jgi:hypothetical protein
MGVALSLGCDSRSIRLRISSAFAFKLSRLLIFVVSHRFINRRPRTCVTRYFVDQIKREYQNTNTHQEYPLTRMIKSAHLGKNLRVDILLGAVRLNGRAWIKIFRKIRTFCLENARCFLGLVFADQQPDWHRKWSAAIKIDIFIGQAAGDFMIIQQ